ncbi:hypothetical protein [Lentzea sp. NPDC092896]|uniref:hypothetical protein n=1 Tax=Lentzea sp. NPDC092896 TaxID=3364127 RepID=UPI00380A0350
MSSDFSSDATLALRRLYTDPTQIAYIEEQRRRAARVLAGSFARDADDCALLLDALGLTPQDGLTAERPTS